MIFEYDDYNHLAIDVLAGSPQRIRPALRRDTYYVTVLDPVMCRATSMPDPKQYPNIVLENIVLNAIRPDNPRLQSLNLGQERRLDGGALRLSIAFEANGQLAQWVQFSVSENVQTVYGILIGSGVRAPKEAVLATAIDIVNAGVARTLTMSKLRQMLAVIDAAYLINDLLWLDIMTLPLGGGGDGGGPERYVSGDGLTQEAYDHMTPAAVAIYNAMRENGGAPDQRPASWYLTTTFDIINTLAAGAGAGAEPGQALFRMLVYEPSEGDRYEIRDWNYDMYKKIGRLLSEYTLPGYPYGYYGLIDEEEEEEEETEEEQVQTEEDLWWRLYDDIPVAVRNQYYASVLGSTYRNINFTDPLGDAINVGEYLDESSDNILFKINGTNGSMIFGSSREAAKKAKPLHECIEDMWTKARRNQVVRPRYTNLANIGCPCVGVASYDAVMTLLHSDYQVIVLRESANMSGKLISYDVLYREQNGFSDAHCQDGTQSRIYQVYMPEV